MSKKKRAYKRKKARKKDLSEQEAGSAAEKEINENILQCLCLAKWQLGSVNLEDCEKVISISGEVQILLRKAITDLRQLAKQLSPDGSDRTQKPNKFNEQ